MQTPFNAMSSRPTFDENGVRVLSPFSMTPNQTPEQVMEHGTPDDDSTGEFTEGEFTDDGVTVEPVFSDAEKAAIAKLDRYLSTDEAFDPTPEDAEAFYTLTQDEKLSESQQGALRKLLADPNADPAGEPAPIVNNKKNKNK